MPLTQKYKDLKSRSLIYSFHTIDLCIDCLIKLGGNLDYEKEQSLQHKYHIKFNEVIIFYDPYDLLNIN